MTRHSALILASPAETDIISAGLEGWETHAPKRPSTSDELVDAISQSAQELIIIVKEKADQSLAAAIKSSRAKQPAAILVFSETADANMSTAMIEAGATSFIVNGFNQQRIALLADIALERQRVQNVLLEQACQAQQQIETRIVIERAKGILMAACGWTEPQAYREMRNLSMHSGKPLTKIAESVELLRPLFASLQKPQ